MLNKSKIPIFLSFLGGILVGAFLVVEDEILTLALYCGRDCKYPYPFIGAFSLYDAEIIATSVILIGMAIALVSSWTSRSSIQS